MEDSGFSGVVRLSNVSDFIAPNLDCIIPLETKTVEKKPEPSLVNIRKKEKVVEEGKPKEKTSIKISLADCLACNGCITSAETVLIEEQSLSRVFEGVAGSKLSVVTVSPQAICSISAKLGVGTEEVARMISAYFLSRGVSYVIDSSFARQLSLSLAFDELNSIPSTSRPLLSSACPGFVCYAEKSHGELLVPKISKIRSPQAVSGAIVKNYLGLKFGIEACQIFHASIMPCFDKKLEASREQLKAEGTEVRETDCVVSTAELFEEIEKFSKNPDFEAFKAPEGLETNSWLTDLSRGRIIGEYGGSSGGYAEKIVRSYLELNGGNLKNSKLNKNMETIEVSDNDGNVKCRVAKVYGFRNIQNLVRKMKTKKSAYDYVEIMACPGGCGNGGGQIRYETSDLREQKLAEVDRAYEELVKDGREEEQIRSLTEEWAKLNPNWKTLLITDYKAVETNISQVLKW